MILITGATGNLGRHVVAGLLERVPAAQLAVAVRDPSKAQDFAARGVAVRRADYNDPASFDRALAGIDKVLLISSSEVGRRAAQHQTVIDAAKRAGVELIAYTSILRADSSPLALAEEHKATEQALQASGVPHVLLRNGWYFENYTEHLAPALQHATFIGSAGAGRISAASRADYAAAAVEVLTTAGHAGKTYELAGDDAFSMAELAAQVSKQVGRAIGYQDLPAENYLGALLGAGVPEPMARVLVDADLGAAQGALENGDRVLRALIGRATTPLSTAVAQALSASAKAA